MSKALKGLGFSAVALLLTMPAAVLAQWDTGITNAQSSGVPTGTITGIIQITMNWLLAILGFLGIIGFVISGILYLTAAGNEGRIDQAKNAMIYSFVGIIVALIGFVVIRAVNVWLGGTTTSF